MKIIIHCNEAQRRAKDEKKRGPRFIMFKGTWTKGTVEMALWTSWDICIKLPGNIGKA